MYLPPGAYAIAFRVVEVQEEDSSLQVELSGQVAPQMVATTSKNDPTEVSDSGKFLFDSGEESGEVWLSVNLGANSRVAVETSAVNGAQRGRVAVSTIVELLEVMYPLMYVEFVDYVRMVEPIGYGILGDRMRSRSRASNLGWDMLIRNFRGLAEPDFDRELFEIVLRQVSDIWPDESASDPVVERYLRQLLIGFNPDLGRIVTRSIGVSQVDSYIRIWDAETDTELVSDDDGGSESNAKAEYETKVPRDLLIQVVRCCTEPFGPGQKLVLDVAIESVEDFGASE